MIYVCSDIHGRYDRWRALLQTIGIRHDDTLYVLGDVIDRGSDGCQILLDMMDRPKVLPILGNHEFTAALCLPWLMEQASDRPLTGLDDTRLTALQEWIVNGGGSTIRGLKELSWAERGARRLLLCLCRKVESSLYKRTWSIGLDWRFFQALCFPATLFWEMFLALFCPRPIALNSAHRFQEKPSTDLGHGRCPQL